MAVGIGCRKSPPNATLKSYNSGMTTLLLALLLTQEGTYSATVQLDGI